MLILHKGIHIQIKIDIAKTCPQWLISEYSPNL